MVSVPDLYDREIGVPVPLAAGGRVTTVGQLLFAPRTWVYSTLHPFEVVINEYRLRLGRQVCATLLGARHVPERLCGRPCLQRGAITIIRPFLFLLFLLLLGVICSKKV